MMTCEYLKSIDAMHNEYNLCASRDSMIFTCPGHNRFYEWQIFMHKIFGNMLTDELNSIFKKKKRRKGFQEEGRKKKEGMAYAKSTYDVP